MICGKFGKNIWVNFEQFVPGPSDKGRIVGGVMLNESN